MRVFNARICVFMFCNNASFSVLALADILSRAVSEQILILESGSICRYKTERLSEWCESGAGSNFQTSPPWSIDLSPMSVLSGFTTPSSHRFRQSSLMLSTPVLNTPPLRHSSLRTPINWCPDFLWTKNIKETADRRELNLRKKTRIKINKAKATFFYNKSIVHSEFYELNNLLFLI
jgi:hypothetical protein